MATVTSHYVREALKGAASKGVDTHALLARAGISVDIFNDKSARVHTDCLATLVRLIWAELQDEFMGFTPTRSKPGSFAMMCQLVSRSETLDALFEQGLRFYGLLTDDIEMLYRSVAGNRELVVRMAAPELDPEHFYLEFWLVIWHRLASWMVGQKIKLQSVHFSYPEPEHAHEFKFQFACPCVFDAKETKLCFSDQYTSLSVIRTQRELAHFLKDSPADILTIPGDDFSVMTQLKGYLLSGFDLHRAFPTFETVAKYLHLSEPTLRRRLKSEGTSYQKIKDRLRCDIAIEKIVVQRMSISDVADLLGFSEASAFARAFKLWTGTAPSAYRTSVDS